MSQLNKFSSKITQPRSQGASQAMLYATGMTDEDSVVVGGSCRKLRDYKMIVALASCAGGRCSQG